MSRIVPGFNKPPGQAGTQSDNTGQEAQPTPRTKQANAQANWPQTPRGQRTGNVKLGETGRGKQIADEDVDIPPKMVKWSDITQEDIDAEMKMILETENFDDGTASEHVRTGSLGFSPLAKGKAKAKAKVPPLQMPAPPRPSTPAPKLAQTPREKLDVDGWKAATPRRDAGETKQDPTPLPTPRSNWTPATPREKPRDEKS
jgi:hypothetical protein